MDGLGMGGGYDLRGLGDEEAGGKEVGRKWGGDVIGEEEGGREGRNERERERLRRWRDE